MIESHAVVAARIRQDLADLARLVERVDRAVRAAQRSASDQDLFLDSVALNLHDFYAGLERIFERIASSIDHSTLSGSEWHRELLRQMAVEVPGLRPAVVSAEVAKLLDDYLRFRHVVRHVYAFELDPGRLTPLADALPGIFQRFKAEVEGFAAYLDDLAQQD